MRRSPFLLFLLFLLSNVLLIRAQQESHGSCDISELLHNNDADICNYIRQSCDLNLYHWSIWYFCGDQLNHKIWIIALLILIIIFTFFGFSVITSNFIYPNLNLLSRYLNISERISGLTLLALGNATPDIFSTYSALSSNSSSLAIGELVGSANFVICFVIGAMGILNPFEVNHGEFIKDLYSFLGLMLIACFFVYDQKLWNWECASMIVFYFGYVTYTILFTNDGKDLVIFDEEEQQHLDPRLSPQSTCRSRERAESIMSLDLNKVKTHQKLSVFEVQKVWRALSPTNSEFSDDIFPRPSIARVRSAEVMPSSNLLRAPTKSASTNNIHAHPNILVAPTPQIPQIVIEVPDDEELNAPIGDDDNHLTDISLSEDLLPQHESLMNSGPTELLVQVPEMHSIAIRCEFLKSWRFLLEPFVDEPFTVITVISGFIVLFFNVTIPTYPTKFIDDPDTYSKEIHSRNQLFFFQLFISPFIFGRVLLPGIEWWQALLTSIALVFVNISLQRFTAYTLPIFGFFTSILTVITLSSILIPVLKNIGVIFQISESLLGLTILAIGNSTGDLISNLTLAKLGLSVIGINACFGAPLLYVLFGIGISGLTLNIRNKASFMDIEIENHFKVSSIGLIIMLFFYAIVIPLNQWRIDRRIGIIGVAWWCTITGVNVYLEIRNRKI